MGFVSAADARFVYYVAAAVLGAVSTVIFVVASRRAAPPLRPWCAAAIPAAFGFSLMNVIRVCGYDPAWFVDVGRGLNLYALAVVYSALPLAAIRAARPLSQMLDAFVDEVDRQIHGPA